MSKKSIVYSSVLSLPDTDGLYESIVLYPNLPDTIFVADAANPKMHIIGKVMDGLGQIFFYRKDTISYPDYKSIPGICLQPLADHDYNILVGLAPYPDSNVPIAMGTYNTVTNQTQISALPNPSYPAWLNPARNYAFWIEDHEKIQDATLYWNRAGGNMSSAQSTTVLDGFETHPAYFSWARPSTKMWNAFQPEQTYYFDGRYVNKFDPITGKKTRVDSLAEFKTDVPDLFESNDNETLYIIDGSELIILDKATNDTTVTPLNNIDILIDNAMLDARSGALITQGFEQINYYKINPGVGVELLTEVFRPSQLMEGAVRFTGLTSDKEGFTYVGYNQTLDGIVIDSGLYIFQPYF